ncbi:helix-turn-helix transcriptional regulator [Telmatocola sphagniphila]|uniref:Helix-turn-helix transcriptional regulator n=1 Tax=Telmatocola sphagniphila TaxID=1123043 RepID=A0A8E6B4B0_9BACT|nr:helix-turn-helix transcriptional regulator [Telmatocola sphagniphila]QVL31647.1 helix-turn-helix transcriptional regulator [Telmatocola sphagniphila]
MNLDDQEFLRLLGSRIREVREKKGWTQAELAEKCQLHRTFIGSVERGERNLSLLNLRLIARNLRISLSTLFSSGPI